MIRIVIVLAAAAALATAAIAQEAAPTPAPSKIYSKPILHDFWAYICGPSGCRRTTDNYEGPPAKCV
jgi:hypothetical protein